MSYTTPAVTIDGHNTSRDATGANAFLLHTAREACYVKDVTFQPLGDNSATAARAFVNNGKAISEGKNNKLWGEVTLAQTTGTGETAAVASTPLPLGIYLEAGQRLLVTVGVSVSAGFDASASVAKNYQDFNV